MRKLTYNVTMEDDDIKSRNLTQLLLLLLAFIAGIFAARFWYDTHPVEPTLELPAEAEISTQVQESTEVSPDLTKESTP